MEHMQQVICVEERCFLEVVKVTLKICPSRQKKKISEVTYLLHIPCTVQLQGSGTWGLYTCAFVALKGSL